MPSFEKIDLNALPSWFLVIALGLCFIYKMTVLLHRRKKGANGTVTDRGLAEVTDKKVDKVLIGVTETRTEMRGLKEWVGDLAETQKDQGERLAVVESKQEKVRGNAT